MRPVAHFEPHPEAPALLARLEAELGLGPERFAAYRFWRRTPQGSVWLAAADCAPPPGVAVDALGLLVYREPPPRGRPTSVFALRFGAWATRGVLDLEPAAAQAALAGELAVPCDTDGAGWRILRAAGRPIGWGWLKAGHVRPELPHAWLQDLDASG